MLTHVIEMLNKTLTEVNLQLTSCSEVTDITFTKGKKQQLS